MRTYEIPRNYKGEGKILYVFSTKALIYTVIGVLVGLPLYYIFKTIKMEFVGIVIDLIFGAIGFAIATFKMPDTKKFEITKKTGGENIDDVIKRWIKFKKNKGRVYIWKQTEKETEDKNQ